MTKTLAMTETVLRLFLLLLMHAATMTVRTYIQATNAVNQKTHGLQDSPESSTASADRTVGISIWATVL